MLTLQLPTLLALLGTVLMAVVIFAPPRAAAVRVTASFAPPMSPSPVERWSVRRETSEPWPVMETPVIEAPPPAIEARREPVPSWPALVDPRAADCDAGARLALADALATVRAPWADAILRRALDDEPDPAVREALLTALV